jgi:DNA-binding NtrC family response regulator
MSQILVVDDEVGIRELLSEILHDEGHDVMLAENATAAREARNNARPDLVLLDIWMPDSDGITLLKEWSANGQLTMPVIMMSGHGTIDTAVEATRIGALDFLEKPIALQKLIGAVKRGLHNKAPALAAAELTLAAFPRSAALRDLKKRLEQIADKSASILLRSQPAGIAELCARTLQPAGKAWLDLALHPMPVDLALLDNIRGGMLFVAELAQLSRAQQKNLSFTIERLERFSLRLITATSLSSAELLRSGWEDALVRRLSEMWLAIPTLAELKDEIPEIVSQLLVHLIEAGEVPARRMSTSALNMMRNQSWPGGYAELKAAVRSLALAALDEEITDEDVRRLIAPTASTASFSLPLDLPLREAREAFERLYFEHHLRHDGGNMTRLAEKTGLERTHLYRKLKALRLPLGRKNEE